MSFTHRWTPRLALLLACASLPVTSANAEPAVDEAASPAASPTPAAEAQHSVASVKIELKQASGKVLKYDGAMLEWGADGNVEIKYEDHVHDIALRIERPDDKQKQISLTVGYSKDGQAVIEPTTLASEIKKREVVRIDGGVAIAITVTPKNVKGEGDSDPVEPPEETEKPKTKTKKEPAPPAEPPKEEEPPKPKKKRIEGPGSDDPLEGLK
ncbi:MAG: hypothetical protein IAG13_25565 [Deltaproteobacteria bacterium]|nr:hypothetical protein [Nannocystaceae bacterium]